MNPLLFSDQRSIVLVVEEIRDDCFLALVSMAGLVVSHPSDIAENSVIYGVQTAILLPAEH